MKNYTFFLNNYHSKEHLVKTLFFTLLTFILLFTVPASPQAKEGEARDGVFIHITHGREDAHRLLMGFKMALNMAEAGKDVIIYCDIEAVKTLTEKAKDIKLKEFLSLHEMITKLHGMNIKIMACPTCMKVAGINEKQLRKEVIVANRDYFFNFTKGRILTLDY